MYPNRATKPATADSGTRVAGLLSPDTKDGIPSDVTAGRVGSSETSGILPGSDKDVVSNSDAAETVGRSAAESLLMTQTATVATKWENFMGNALIDSGMGCVLGNNSPL